MENGDEETYRGKKTNLLIKDGRKEMCKKKRMDEKVLKGRREKELASVPLPR